MPLHLRVYVPFVEGTSVIAAYRSQRALPASSDYVLMHDDILARLVILIIDQNSCISHQMLEQQDLSEVSGKVLENMV